MKKKVSLILNLVLIFAIAFIIIKENYFRKFSNLLNNSPSPYNFENNWQYQQELSLYKAYKKTGNIVMMGNSITYRVNWNELLNRTDVINRGIGDDTTAGFLSRIDQIENTNAKLCFIMGGINDIRHNISTDSITKNILVLTDQLISKQIKPVLLSVLFVSSEYPDSENINKRVKAFNNQLKTICKAKSITFVDLNNNLSEDNLLKSEYSFDGIHLTGSGYIQVRKAIVPIIEKNIDILEFQ